MIFIVQLPIMYIKGMVLVVCKLKIDKIKGDFLLGGSIDIN